MKDENMDKKKVFWRCRSSSSAAARPPGNKLNRLRRNFNHKKQPVFTTEDTERHSRNQTQYPISNTEYPISNITADFQYPISRPTKRDPAGRENIRQRKFWRRDARGNLELSRFPLQTKNCFPYSPPAARRA